MARRIAPQVTKAQAPLVTDWLAYSESMKSGLDSSREERREFARRLNLLCDELDPPIPPKGKGRQGAVAAIFHVNQKGARKWLEGEAIPTMMKCIEMAKKFDVHFEWFMTGRGPKRSSDLIDRRDIAMSQRLMAMPPEDRRAILALFHMSDSGPGPKGRERV